MEDDGRPGSTAKPCLKTKAEQNEKTPQHFHSLVTIGDLAELTDSHGFLLYVVLSEEARLTSHQLLDGRGDDQIINIIVGCSRLPLLGRNNLQGTEKRADEKLASQHPTSA